MTEFRIEKDSLGEVRVPAAALWGAQTQRAVENFPVSGQPMPPEFIASVVQVKRAAAQANASLGLLEPELRDAICDACDRLLKGEYDDQFPVDRYQTGSGTSTNMNVNEVIAALASSQGVDVHPNDHVNMSQSSNDVIPTAIHISAVLAVKDRLLPALSHLRGVIYGREAELSGQVKTGRTHLMDAMPVTLGQELRTWREQLAATELRLEQAMDGLGAITPGRYCRGYRGERGVRVCRAVCEVFEAQYGLSIPVAGTQVCRPERCRCSRGAVGPVPRCGTCTH